MRSFSRLGLGLALSLTASAVLAACETQEGYRQQVSAWQGQHVDDLLIEWGPPDTKTTLSDGREVWVYKIIEERHGGGYTTNEFVDRSYSYIDADGNRQTRRVTDSHPVWVPPYTTRYNCNTHFVVTPENTVNDISFKGEGCVAPEMD